MNPLKKTQVNISKALEKLKYIFKELELEGGFYPPEDNEDLLFYVFSLPEPTMLFNNIAVDKDCSAKGRAYYIHEEDKTEVTVKLKNTKDKKLGTFCFTYHSPEKFSYEMNYEGIGK